MHDRSGISLSTHKYITIIIMIITEQYALPTLPYDPISSNNSENTEAKQDRHHVLQLGNPSVLPDDNNIYELYKR